MLRDKKIKNLEKQFITRSSSAFAAAWRKSRTSGQSVVISDKGALYRVRPDGARELLKQIEPPTQVRRGLKLHIQ